MQLCIQSCNICKNSVRLMVRGTTDFNGGAYTPSKTSPSYALTTLIIFRSGTVGKVRWLQLRDADTTCALFLRSLRPGVHLSSAPYDQLLAPQVSYLLLGRCSTDRPLTPCTDVRRHWFVQRRLGMALFFIAIGYG